MSGFHKHMGMLVQISCIIPGIIWNSIRILAWIITIPSIPHTHPHYSLISLLWREENPGHIWDLWAHSGALDPSFPSMQRIPGLRTYPCRRLTYPYGRLRTLEPPSINFSSRWSAFCLGINPPWNIQHISFINQDPRKFRSRA